MSAIEFQANVTDGIIELPKELRYVRGPVTVIVFSGETVDDASDWPQHNRRRWELIVRKARHGLNDEETKELAELQERADAQLAQVGPRPMEHLEQLYAELSQQD